MTSTAKPFAAGFLAGAAVTAVGFAYLFGAGDDPARTGQAPTGQTPAEQSDTAGDGPADPGAQEPDLSADKLRATLDVACGAVTAGYPFATPRSGAAAGAEVSPAAFVALFGPQGAFAQYEAAAPVVPGSPAQVAFQAAGQIRATFLGGFDGTIQLPLKITPFELHSGIERATLDIGPAQVVTLRRGNQVAEPVWEAGQPLSVAFAPEEAGAKNSENTGGNWALLRFVEKYSAGQVEGDTKLRVALGGRHIVYRLRSDASDVTAAIALLRGFQCPIWADAN